MKKSSSALKKRMLEQRGESIGEVLVALLISSVALVMLASMISVSRNLISESRDKLAAYYQANDALTVHSESADGVDKSGNAVTFTYSLISNGTLTNYDPIVFENIHYLANPADSRIVAYWE